MTLNTVTLRWDLTDLIESGLSATLSIMPTAQLSDITDHLLIPPVARTVNFAGGTGQLAGIVANDNAAITPSGTGYLISVVAANGVVIVPQLQTQILFANGATQWLDQLVTVPVVTTSYQYLPLPSGTPAADTIPVATGAGEATAWQSRTVATVAAFLAQTGPKVVAHRGLPQVAPEHTMPAYRAAIAGMLALGYVPAIKLDVYFLADQSAGVMHDSTVNRTTTATGNVTAYGAQPWKTLLINGAQTGPAWGNQVISPPLLSEVLDELGGKCVFVIEVKSSGTTAFSTVLGYVTARRLTQSVIMTGEDTTLLLPPLAKAAGVGFWYYWLVNPITSPVTPAQAVATSGVTALSAAVNQGNAFADADVTSIVSAAHGAGLPASGFTYTRRYDYQRAISQFGIDVHAVNDLYVTGTAHLLTADLFAAGTPVAGEVGSTLVSGQSAYAPSYSYAGGAGNYRRQMTPAEGLGGVFEACGFLCPALFTAGVYTFTGTVFWDVAETSTSDGATWAGILVGATDDRFFDSNAHASGYQCAIRQGNGSTYSVPTLQIYKQNPGAYQNNGSYATGSGVKQGSDVSSTTGFAAPNTLNASYASGAAVTSLTLGSNVSIPAGMKIALPNGQIATVASPVTSSATVTIASLTLTSALFSGQAVSFGIPFSVKFDTSVPGSVTITFKRTDTGDTNTITDSSSPYTGQYIHIGKAGTGSSGSTLTLSYANLATS